MSAAEKLPADQPGVITVRHDQLVPSPLNPRKHARTEAEIAELAASIASKGVLQNLVVRAHPEDKKLYEIAAGEGRWRAVAQLIAEGKAAASYPMPVALRDLSDTDMIEIGLIENLQRNDLHPLDEARAFLALHDAHAKILGRKAAARAVEKIAQQISRSTRYVQKRIKVARDLIPAFAELLDAGVLQLQTALALSGMPAKAQAEELESLRDYQTKEVDPDRVRALTPHRMADDWRPLSGALFDLALYTGETEDVDGEAHATDVKQFDALQKAAAAAFVRDMRAKKKAGEISFFDELQYFDPTHYEQAEGEGLGVALVKTYDGEIRVYRNLVKSAALAAREEKQKAAKLAEAKRNKRDRDNSAPAKVKKAAPDARIVRVREVAAKDEHLRAALAVYLSTVSYSDRPHWLDDALHEDGLAILKAARGGALPSGGKLVAWLLERKTSFLKDVLVANAAAIEILDRGEIEAPTPVEKAIFAYCGIESGKDGDFAMSSEPPAKKKPKAKPRTASKSKPSKKKGKRK